jgi:hypothetical protein
MRYGLAQLFEEDALLFLRHVARKIALQKIDQSACEMVGLLVQLDNMAVLLNAKLFGYGS